jgi:uncharacterized protein
MYEKDKKLDEILKDNMPVAIAFSGGVDSTFLLKKAVMINKDETLAVYVDSPIMSSFERQEAMDFLKENNINYIILKKNPFEIKEFTDNPKDKCYYCKKQVFKMILETANENGYDYVADGSNESDIDDYRPGMKALRELGIKSPLKEAGLTKGDIRILSKNLGLKTWNKPPNACLATRVVTGIKIKEDVLIKIDKAEDYIRKLGISQVRVRVHEKNLVRIELDKKGLELIRFGSYFEDIAKKLGKIGFEYITLDIEGYKKSGLR